MNFEFTTDTNMTVKVKNANSEMQKFAANVIRTKYENELRDFVQEVMVAIRKSKPGDRIELKSKPIEVVIENTDTELDVEKLR